MDVEINNNTSTRIQESGTAAAAQRYQAMLTAAISTAPRNSLIAR
jgi:hypothetical protein